MKLLSTGVLALSIAACGGVVEHRGGFGGGDAAGTGGVGSGAGSAGLGACAVASDCELTWRCTSCVDQSAACELPQCLNGRCFVAMPSCSPVSGGTGGNAGAQCASYSDCPVPQICQQCLDDLVACARVECISGVCVNATPDCGAGGTGGAAGAGGTAGAAGQAGSGDSGACQMLRAQADQALTLAQACGNSAGQCQTTVLTPCGCEVPDANGPNSYTTFYYQSALDQLQAAPCRILCPLACPPVTAASCHLDATGNGACAPD